ncbi:MAG: hypothetical protein AAFV93_13000 [Chloroflexota bacterium]
MPQLLGFYAFLQFLLTMLPLHYPQWMGAYGGTTSDGYKAYSLLCV